MSQEPDEEVKDFTILQREVIHRGVPAVVLWGLLAVAMLALGGVGALALYNTSRIDKAQQRLDHRERLDNARRGRALARICARENLTRGEVHVAFSRPAFDPAAIPPAARSQEPLLVSLLVYSEKNRVRSNRRVLRTLPILDCAPNLRGLPATALSEAEQKRFVKVYEADKLDPTPDARDVRRGQRP